MAQSARSVKEQRFTPALGYAPLTPFYDVAVAALTRESTWRSALVEMVQPLPGDRILDVGCGTGTLALMLKKTALNATVIGLDPDPTVLVRGTDKADANALSIEWHEGFLTAEFASAHYPVTKVVSSLVLHQTPVSEKRRLLKHMHLVLEPGGRVFIADYGLQRSTFMRYLFRCTVQAIDGVEDTTPNAEGKVPEYLLEAGFEAIEELRVIPTLTGSISLYRGKKPSNGGADVSV